MISAHRRGLRPAENRLGTQRPSERHPDRRPFTSSPIVDAPMRKAISCRTSSSLARGVDIVGRMPDRGFAPR